MENEDFRSQIEELFRLFKKLIEKGGAEAISGMDAKQVEQLNNLLSQYDLFKDKLSIEINKIDVFGQHMIKAIIEELRNQLGEEDYAPQTNSAIDIIERDEKEMLSTSSSIDKIDAVIAKIDQQLMSPNLEESEIDALLDKRQQIIEKKSKMLQEGTEN